MSIYRKLWEAQKAIEGIAKTGHNAHFNYAFFEEREVLKVARDALNNAGLAFIYSVEDVTDREVETKNGRVEWITDVRMRCTIYDSESGEKLEGGAIGRGQDGQDKGINKAIVAGLKYWLLKTLMIPTDDDTERDEHTNTEGNQRRTQVPRTQQAPRAPHPNSTPVGVQHSNVPDILEQTLSFGKHKGRTWGDLLENEPDYIEWAIEKMDRLAPEARDYLKLALAERKMTPVAVGQRPDVPLSEPDDDMPFS